MSLRPYLIEADSHKEPSVEAASTEGDPSIEGAEQAEPNMIVAGDVNDLVPKVKKAIHPY